MWYTRTEQTLRAGLMYTNLSVFITGPVGYALGSIGGGHQWKYYFYILGGISIIWAAIVGIFLPDSPTKAKLVTERQKAITVEKLRADQTGVENKMLKKEQVWEALLDPKTWLLFFFNIFCSIPNGGLTSTFTPHSASHFLTCNV
jgi:MFS family permease